MMALRGKSWVLLLLLAFTGCQTLNPNIVEYAKAAERLHNAGASYTLRMRIPTMGELVFGPNGLRVGAPGGELFLEVVRRGDSPK